MAQVHVPGAIQHIDDALDTRERQLHPPDGRCGAYGSDRFGDAAGASATLQQALWRRMQR